MISVHFLRKTNERGSDIASPSDVANDSYSNIKTRRANVIQTSKRLKQNRSYSFYSSFYSWQLIIQ